MKNIYNTTNILDKLAIDNFCLSEDILMENAAANLETALLTHLQKIENHCKNKILILCGSGDNGGDGYVLARRLFGTNYLSSLQFDVLVFEVLESKSNACILQKKRWEKIGGKTFSLWKTEENNFDFFSECCKNANVIFDCIFGSGFHGTISPYIMKIISMVNSSTAYKIACDIPSGLEINSHETITMGALKSVLFSDKAKNVVGKISVANLGIQNALFENKSIEPDAFLLNSSDMKLPLRNNQNCHKGNFGHLCVLSGDKIGASIIAGNSALSFGAGLVSVLETKKIDTNINLSQFGGNLFQLMYCNDVPEKTTALCAGMGLGQNNFEIFFHIASMNPKIPVIIDADLFYSQKLPNFLEDSASQNRQIILTPHPKEFVNLLTLCGILKEDGSPWSVPEIDFHRFKLVEDFCKKYPGVVLLLKGANVLIGQYQNQYQNQNHKTKIFVNTLGSNALAKAGSGDVLAGLIASLMAQKYDSLDATITASLAHSIASNKFKNNFSLTPFDLIEAIKTL